VIDVAKQENIYLSAFERLEGDAARAGSWLGPIRRSAIERFAAAGFPTTRDEAWKYTNVSSIAKTPFRLAPRREDGSLPRGSMSDVEALTFGAWSHRRVVFVNGHYSAALSSAAPAGNGLQAVSLAAGLSTERALLEAHLARRAAGDNGAFTALNTAFFPDGALVRIPDRAILPEPIHIVYVSAPPPGEEAQVSHPRTLVVAGEGSQATIVESYVGLGSDAYFTNAVTEVVAGPGCVIDHYKLEREAAAAYHVGNMHVSLSRGSVFSSHSIALGGGLVRNDVTAVLGGEGAECTLNGLYVLSGSQHVDNHTFIDHARPRGTSRQLYKGVLDGRARGVFDGMVIVRPDAQKTDSRQENRNLILSEEALVDTKPTLKIHADDVKCSHAATTGQMDETSMFYLRSRGIDVPTARRIMIHAFVSDILSRIKVEAIRSGLDTLYFCERSHTPGGGS